MANKPASPNTYTIEVSVEDSQKLSVAATLGTLSLALRGAGAADIAKAPPLRTNDFLTGGGGGPARGPVRVASARPAYSGIMIVEGEAVKREAKQPKVKIAAPKPTIGSADDVVWRRSKLGLTMTKDEIAALDAWMAGA